MYAQLSVELAELYLRLYREESGLLRSEIIQWAPIIAGAKLSEVGSPEDSERLIKIINSSL